MTCPASVADHVHRRRHEPRVFEALEERDRSARQVLLIHVEDGVAERLRGPGRANGTERGAVLDEPALAAMEPDEVWNPVHVRVRAGRERGEADRRQRREGRHRTAIAAVVHQEAERRDRLPLDRVLQHPRREAVDDDQDELLGGHQLVARERA